MLVIIGAWKYQFQGKNIPNMQHEIVEQTEKKVISLTNRIESNSSELFECKRDEFLQWCEDQGLDGFRFVKGSPDAWSDFRYQIDESAADEFRVVEQNAVYLGVWSLTKGTTKLIFIDNLLDMKFPPVDLNKPWKKSIDIFIGGAPLENASRLTLPTLKNQKTEAPVLHLLLFDYEFPPWSDAFIFIGILLVSIGIYLFGIEQYTRKYAILNAFIWLLYVLGLQREFIGDGIRGYHIFNENIFSLNPIYGSLAESLIFALIGLWVIRFILFHFHKLRSKIPKIGIVIFSGVIHLGAFSLFYYTWELAEYLVLNPGIHFRFTELLLISWETILTLLILAIQIIGGITLYRSTLNQSLKVWFTSLQWDCLISWGAVALLAVFIGADKLFVLFTFGLGLLLYLPNLFSEGRQRFYRWLFEVLVPSLLLGFVFSKSLNQNELKERELFASTLMISADDQVKAVLLDAENALTRDLPVLFKAGIIGEKGDALEANIQQQYFSELAEGYNLSLFAYNEQGQSINSDKSIEYGTLNAMYYGEKGIQVTKRFFLMNERRLSGSYMGKFSIKNDSAVEATYFLILTPNGDQSKGRLTDVLSHSEGRELLHRNNYSYAVYSGRKLSKHYGEYDYRRIYSWPSISQGNYVYSEPNYMHSISEDDYGNLIVVSKPRVSWLVSSIQYTLVAFYALLLAILINSFSWIENLWKLKVNPAYWQRVHQGDENLLFSSRYRRETWFISRRLQVYIIWLLILIFGLVIYFTVNYFTINNADKQEEMLLNKTNQIANRISGQSNLNALVNQYEVGLIYNLAESYQTDINIYDPSGFLIVSTNPRLYNERFLSKFMNPHTFERLNSGESSSLIEEENISDLNYISAYTLINDNNLEVRGYVNLPYFSNREDLYHDISNYTVTILNLFILVFLLVFLVTAAISKRITQPLLLIRDELAQMKLGEKHEPISWYRNDEIGLLVNEYNKMIDALDDSVNKLSEVERQGAWREMAKQVAHEIKNPLTPMRLSLQHLEFAIHRNDDNIQKKISKTIQLLIRQIDSLSTMAEEFSSFAKMPDPKIEKVDFTLVLTDAAALMEKEMGIRIPLEIPKQEIWLHADAHQLGRVFNNLFKNALQAIPEDRVAQVSSAVKFIASEKIEVVVRDNGKGIPKDLYKKIFSPNFSTKNSGMGLGLAITKKIINQFGGDIRFESEENVGTTFYLTFPVLQEN